MPRHAGTTCFVVFALCAAAVWSAPLCKQCNGVPLHTPVDDPVLSVVDLAVGTGGFGYGSGAQLPGPQVPWGLVRLGPDTTDADNGFIDFTHNGGFHYADRFVREFSHLHMVGAGVADYGNIGVMPSSRAPVAKDTGGAYGWRRSIAHQQMSPGYYGAALEALDKPSDVIVAELTAAATTGTHRYTFAANAGAYILLDLQHTLPPKAIRNASLSVNPTTGEITGWQTSAGSLGGRIGGITVYLSMVCNTPMASFGVWNNGSMLPKGTTALGDNIGAWLSFEPSSQPLVVECHVGISMLSVAQAQRNRNRDTASGTANFDAVRSSAETAWRDTLAVASVEAPNAADRAKFYSFLYRACMAPTTFSEADGKYLGFDHQEHTLQPPQERFMSDMSIWDIHRTQAPLLATLFPNVSRDVVRSLLNMLEQGGDLPKWPFANGYGECMDGTHASVVIGDAFARGVTDFNTTLAYQGMYQGATSQRPHAGRDHIDDWLTLGFIPYEHNTKGACDTLAYSYDDASIALFASNAGVGKAEDIAALRNRSKNYHNVFDPANRFFCPRSTNKSHEWECPPEWINVFDDRYVEGDAWHYRFFVPHDVPGLVDLFGGPQAFVKALGELMERGRADWGLWLPNPYYWAGNEPDILSPVLFNVAGRPDLTQEHVRWVLDNRFLLTPDGLPGNDDYGTMSAWFVWASLGLYPLAGTDQLFVTSPVYSRATLRLEQNAYLTIIANNASSLNVYVQRFELNGQPTQPTLLKHGDVFRRDRNTTLEFWMGSFPAL